MVELLLLLLPVAALSGWMVARRSVPRGSRQSTADLSSNYFKGLNYLLNEQPDKAIEVFIKMLEVDSETVETHLALGNLFRRRGEVDRAIRIHQNIIARPTLSRQQRTQALFELGIDYMRAGLLDRAESLFQELTEINEHTEAALYQLIDIYQQEKDWDKAIAAVRKLEEVTGKRKEAIIAHYYCELAEEAGQEGNREQGMQMIKQALASDKNCVRASILQGDIEREAGDYKAAIRAYKRVEQQGPDYLAEVIEPLVFCHRRLGTLAELIEYLRQVLRSHGGITAMLTLAELIQQQNGDRAAVEFITGQLRARPSVRGLDRLIELSLANSQGEARDNLLIIQDLTNNLLEGRPGYRCNNCGFTGKSMHWQCPGCKQWNTVKPVQGVVGE